METDGWPLGRPQSHGRGEFKLIKSFEEALKDFERSQIASLGIKKELIESAVQGRDRNKPMTPEYEGVVMSYQDPHWHEDERGGYTQPPIDVMVLVVIPPELCRHSQTILCKPLERGRGTPIGCDAMAEWVRNAGLAAGLDPEERVILASPWELS